MREKYVPAPDDKAYGPQGILRFMLFKDWGSTIVYRNYNFSCSNSKDPNLDSAFLAALDMTAKSSLGKMGENGVSKIELEGLEWRFQQHNGIISSTTIDPSRYKAREQKGLEAKLTDIIDYLCKNNMIRDGDLNDDAVKKYVDERLGFNHEAVLEYEEELTSKAKSAELLKQMADIEKNNPSIETKLNKLISDSKTKGI